MLSIKANSLLEFNDNDLVIVPDPQTGDSLRLSSDKNLSIVTIAEFIKNSLAKKLDQKITNKQELTFLLALVWKKVSSSRDLNAFLSHVKLLTELRSFTLNEETLAPIWDMMSAESARTIKAFYQFLEVDHLLDEQKAYRNLSHYVQDYPITQCQMIFYGFQFLSGGQIDFIKSLSLRHQVQVCVSEVLMEHSVESDWVRWLVLDREWIKPSTRSIRPQVILYPRNQLSNYLSEFLKTKKPKNIDFFLGTKNLTTEYLFDLPINDVHFKIGFSLFEEDFNFLKDWINSKEGLSFEPLMNDIMKMQKDLLSQEKFKLLKMFSSFLELLKQWLEYNQELEVFDLKVMLDTLYENLQRVSLIPLSAQNQAHRVLSLKNFDQFQEDRLTAFCVSSSYPSLKGGNDRLNPEIRKFLATLGPLKRADLQLYYFSEKIQRCAKSEQCYFFIEDHLWEGSLEWNFILGEEVDFKALSSVAKNKNVTDFFDNWEIKNRAKSLSATSFQSYLDCPRRYYFSYLEKMIPFTVLQERVDARELGQLQHKLIERYFTRNLTLESLAIEFDKIFSEFITYNSKTLNQYDIQKYRIEILEYTQNGILFLEDFIRTENVIKTEFEKPLCANQENLEVRGSIDCLLETAEGFYLFDFKRSSFSIPTVKEVENFMKIQLLFYMYHAPQAKPFLGCGYVDLSDPEKSLLLLNQEEKLDLPIKMYSFNLKEKVDEYQAFQQEKTQQLQSDKIFLPNPRKPDVCIFCELKNICSKGRTYAT